MIILRYDIPKEQKVSLNKIYAGVHWSLRKRYADYRHNITKQDTRELEQIKTKVDLHFEYYFKRPLDSSNCSFMSKMIEDGLVKGGLFKDDSHKYIGIVSNESKKGQDFVRIFINSHKGNTNSDL